MGGGDIKLFALLGWVLGVKLILLSLVLSSLYGTLFGLAGMMRGSIKRKTPIPFGIFIALGSLTAYLFGAMIIQTYMNWIYK